MDPRLALTDLRGNALAFLDGYEKFTITPRLNGHAEISIELPRGLGIAGDLVVASRAIQLFDGGTPRFFGKVWEPLTLSSQGHKLTARDPLAEFLQRRARVKTEYTATNNGGGPWDAAEIVYDRLAQRNANRNTYLREGTADASVNQERVVLPGTLEKDVVDELADSEDGFFYRAVPVIGVADVMADLDIYYPDAGVERVDAVFAYGDGTVGNLLDYEIVDYLPKNRIVVSSSEAEGGRIAEAAENTSSIAEYGLFEDELTYNDVTDTVLLAQHAAAELKITPPRTITAEPGPDAPLLFTDFDIGDFVRLQLRDDGLDVLEWARVVEASLEVNREGNARLVGISFELLIGATLTVAPHLLFRRQLDDRRRRLEALERKQQVITTVIVESPAEPTPTEPEPPTPGDPGAAPAPPPPPPPPPPPAPPEPPTVSIQSATGMNFRENGVLRRGIHVVVNSDYKGLSGTSQASAGGVSAGLGGGVQQVFLDLQPGTYTVAAVAITSAGRSAATAGGIVVPAITQE